MQDYQPSDYWETLLAGRFDLSGVGHPEFPPAFNRALYEQMLRCVSSMIAAHAVRVRDAAVLEIGPGTGFWVKLWDDMGAGSVTGVDLTVTAVERLRERFPDHAFHVADVGSDEARVSGAYDLVSAMSVLLHIVDDGRFRVALANIASMLERDGAALLMEPLVVHRWWGPPFDSTANSRARTIGQWRAALDEAGLELVDHRPVTALLSNVCDTRRRVVWRAHQVYWGVVRIALVRAPKVTGPVTAVLVRVDRWLVDRGISPSAKVMLVRHASPTGERDR
jgi:predicted TPR repeat methyltransferase